MGGGSSQNWLMLCTYSPTIKKLTGVAHTHAHSYTHTTYIHTNTIHIYIHTNANANFAATEWSGGPGYLCTKQALGACASREWARNLQKDQLPSHGKWCGQPKSYLDH